MWTKINWILGKFKKFPLFQLLYKIPGAPMVYHGFLALFGAVLYGFPANKLFVIGVTGTKGKTTAIEILNAILEAAGKKTALLSSLRIKIGGHSEKNNSGNTMPGRFYVQKFLRRAVAEGCNYALIEVTSEGVVLSRHRFIAWNAGILTNIAPEHIEAHGSFENYRKAKLGFLKYVLGRGGRVFINHDDKSSKFFSDVLAGENITFYSKNDENILPLIPVTLPLRGVAEPCQQFVLSDFNKDNIAAAASLAKDLGVNEKTILETLRSFDGVPGRMEFIRRGPFTVVIDYAHTPDSLEAVYKHLRGQMANRKSLSDTPYATSNKLICVLGASGGGRDKWKRPVMGKIAAQYCDEIVLTNEDPYDENPEEIIEQIAKGCYEFKPPSEVFKILDRREAIEKAAEFMGEGDIVVLTGKGSEDSIHVARGKKISWNERAAVEEILKDKQK